MQSGQQKKCLKGRAFDYKHEQIELDFNFITCRVSRSIDCLIILNCHFDAQWLNLLMNCATNVILADGGANYLYGTQFKQCESIKCIIGDLDSLKPQVEQYYRQKKVEICRVEDQNLNDFEKSLNKAHALGYKECFCVGAIGGRMDHTLSAMHLATKLSNKYKDMQIVLMGDNNLLYYLRSNIKYSIKLSHHIRKDGCGLVTFSHSSMVETTGFKWNMGPGYDFHSLTWGQFISTSNVFQLDAVTVKTASPLFLVCSLNEVQKISKSEENL